MTTLVTDGTNTHYRSNKRLTWVYQHYLWSCDLTRGSHEYAATLSLAMRSNEKLTWVYITHLVVNYQFIIQWSFIYSLGLNHVYSFKEKAFTFFNSVICLDFRYRHTNHTLGIIHTKLNFKPLSKFIKTVLQVSANQNALALAAILYWHQEHNIW